MKHTATSKGGIITYDSTDWKAGLGYGGKFNASPTFKKAVDNGFQQIEAIDPFFSYGSLQPGFQPSGTATNASGLAGTLVAFSVKDNTKAYGIDSGGKLHELTYNTYPGSVNASPHTITGTSPVGQDMIIYRRRTSATTYSTSLFYSYYNNANWDVGCIVDVSQAWASVTFDDDFMSTVPTNMLDVTSGDGDDTYQRTKPHAMCVGADDLLYIGSGRYLHAYDGDTGTQGQFYSQVLKLPVGSEIVGMMKFNDSLLIATNYYSTGSSTGVGEAILYVWNYQDADPSQVIPLEDNYVATIFPWKGAPVVVTRGLMEKSGGVKVKVISGGSVLRIADFDSTVPVLRGVVTSNDVIYLNCGGEIVTVGDRYTKGYAVNHIGTLASSGVSGGLFYDAQPATNSPEIILWGGTSASTTYTFSCIGNVNGLGAGNCRSFSYTPPFPEGKMGKMTMIHVEFSQKLATSASNGAFTLTLYPDSQTAYTIIDSIKVVSLPLAKRYFSTSTGGQLPEFTSFEWLASWTASVSASYYSPIISKISFHYDLKDIYI